MNNTKVISESIYHQIEKEPFIFYEYVLIEIGKIIINKNLFLFIYFKNHNDILLLKTLYI